MEPITWSIQRQCVRVMALSQVELFLDKAFPQKLGFPMTTASIIRNLKIKWRPSAVRTECNWYT